MTTTSSSSILLSQVLAEGKNLIGQIVLKNNFSLRHCEDIDIDPSQLKLYHHPEAAREIARYDAAGNYRPLKTAPNLVRGWLLQLRSIEEMVLAIDFFYPAALDLYGVWLEKNLRTTSFRETLGRQTGMYRITQKLDDTEANSLINKVCEQGCLRNILWREDIDEEAVLSLVEEQQKVPLLCREACNLLVAAARQVVKKRD